MNIIFQSKKCPDCPGSQVNYRSEPACRTCDGSGTVCETVITSGSPAPTPFKEIGEVIHRARMERRILMGMAAKHIGLPIVQYSMLEAGQTDPRQYPLDTRKRFLDVLGIDLTDLG